MTHLETINAGETGLSVRAKLNKMFSDLITGPEGVNAVWNKLNALSSQLNSIQERMSTMNTELGDRITSSVKYTDTTANNLRIYIDGFIYGISAFAEDETFMPNFSQDKSATVMAFGSGVFVNLKDVDGNPIVIEDADAVTIFYRAANTDYWTYRSVHAVLYTDDNADGGNALSKWGGAKVIDGGEANVYPYDYWVLLRDSLPEGKALDLRACPLYIFDETMIAATISDASEGSTAAAFTVTAQVGGWFGAGYIAANMVCYLENIKDYNLYFSYKTDYAGQLKVKLGSSDGNEIMVPFTHTGDNQWHDAYIPMSRFIDNGLIIGSVSNWLAFSIIGENIISTGNYIAFDNVYYAQEQV